MRTNRNNDETEIIARMRSHLRSEDQDVRDDLSITDRPDWVFELNGERVAAELTCINLQQLMEWSNNKSSLDLGKCYEVRFANEPHLWVKKAIEAKNSKSEVYRSRANANSVWLILHTEIASFALFGCSDAMLELMRKAARAIDSDFAAIWFVHAEIDPQLLWEKGDAKCDFPQLPTTDGYPTCRVRQGLGKLTAEGGEFSLDRPEAVSALVVQPLDTRYTI